ncbi:MAG TPA: class A beta-lactamase [Bryobacteraceae bacterium]|nr:class A beta-lactamase [Bryobacteraceae bacterium]
MPLALALWLAFAPPDAALEARFEMVARQARGRVGAAAELMESRQWSAYRGVDRFPLESVAALPIAMAILSEVDRGTLTIQERVRVLPADLVPPEIQSPLRDLRPHGSEASIGELLEYAIRQGDGTASDVLLRLAGGPESVTAFLRGIGLQDIAIEVDEGAIGRNGPQAYRNWATPESALALLGGLQSGRGLSLESRSLLLRLMSTSSTSTHRIPGLLPAGLPVAHKDGTSETAHGVTRATNDVGIVTLPDGRHLAIAVFVSDSPAGEDVREGVIAKIARAAWEHWFNPR